MTQNAGTCFAQLSDLYGRLSNRHVLGLNVLLGGVFVLALPPLGMWFLTPFVLSLFFLSLDAVAPLSRGTVFWRAWAFYFGYFLFGLYWLGSAFLVEDETFLWLMPFAVTLLPAGLAIFYGLAGLVWREVCRRFTPEAVSRLFLFVLVMVLADYVRGHVLTGFPWNLPGMVTLGWLPLAQSAAFWGVYGLGIVVWIFGLLPLIARQNTVIAAGLVVALIGCAGAGVLRVWNMPDLAGQSSPVIRIVQPNLAQAEKWDPALRRAHIDKTILLSRRPHATQPDLVIWPETAVPVLLGQDAELRRHIASVLPAGSFLVSGSVRREYRENGSPHKSYNSLFIVRDGEVMAQYDKHHLVPFGEYLPFQPLLEALGLQQLTRLRGGFAAGPGPAVLSAGALPPFAPMICYEVIFPRRSLPDTRPGWLINVTNDAWFGHTAGPWQHLAMARMRAIEQGLPMARAANTGISALISPKGEIIDHIPLGEAGLLDVALPPALEATPYARHGDLTFLGMFSFVALIAFVVNLCRKDVG